MLDEIWLWKRNEKFYLGLVTVAIVALACQNWVFGLLLAIVALAFILFVKKKGYEQERVLMQYLDDLSQGVEAGTTYAVKNLPLGIAMMDEKRQVIWANDVFRDWADAEHEEDMALDHLLPGIHPSKLWGKSGWLDCQKGEIFFRVFYKYIEPTDEDGSPFMLFYLMDRTDVEETLSACAEAMPVFCLIRIDNISEVVANMTDLEKSNLLSDVDECILGEFSELDGFIKQFGTADFVACISHASLKTLIDRDFDILDKVHEIRTVNRIPVTLSIGIVKSEEPFARQAEEAQAALDLALGRGGDQAVVRIGEAVKVYGGKTQSTGSVTRVRVRVIAHALRETIEESDGVLIMGHAHEDYDALGAAMGLAHLAAVSEKPVHIVVSKFDETSRKMRKAIAATPGMERLLIKDEDAKDLVTDKTLVFITDTHIAEMVAAPKVLAAAKRRIIIDHHRRAASIIPNTLLNYMEPSASSASELVSEIIQYYGKDAEMPQITASCLYAGIIVDTKNFFVQTGIRTFDAASFLRRSGADNNLVRGLFVQDIDTVRIKAEVVNHMRILDETIAIAEIPEDTDQAQILAGKIADDLITVEGIRVSILYYTLDKQHIGISARSDGSINVQRVMETVGGGGHMTVSGAQVRPEEKEEAEEKIIAAIREQMV